MLRQQDRPVPGLGFLWMAKCIRRLPAGMTPEGQINLLTLLSGVALMQNEFIAYTGFNTLIRQNPFSVARMQELLLQYCRSSSSKEIRPSSCGSCTKQSTIGSQRGRPLLLLPREGERRRSRRRRRTRPTYKKWRSSHLRIPAPGTGRHDCSPPTPSCAGAHRSWR